MDLAPSSTADTLAGAPMPESTWVLPVADGRVVATEGDPADVAASRETIRLAFVAALQHLPPRQRAVLVLRDVLHWRASEVADLLDTTVASVNSALQRARATLDAVDLDVHELDATATLDVDDEARELLDRYVDTFERYDIDSLVTLLHDDATFSMPPFPLWLRGPDQVHAWMLGQGIECKDSRLLADAGQRVPGLRRLPRRRRRRAPAVRARRPRGRRRPDHGDPQLPRARALPRVRPARPPGGLRRAPAPGRRPAGARPAPGRRAPAGPARRAAHATVRAA